MTIGQLFCFQNHKQSKIYSFHRQSHQLVNSIHRFHFLLQQFAHCFHLISISQYDDCLNRRYKPIVVGDKHRSHKDIAIDLIHLLHHVRQQLFLHIVLHCIHSAFEADEYSWVDHLNSVPSIF